MNNAFIRRFYLVFELSVPPRSVRKILAESLKETQVNTEWIERAFCPIERHVRIKLLLIM